MVVGATGPTGRIVPTLAAMEHARDFAHATIQFHNLEAQIAWKMLMKLRYAIPSRAQVCL